MSDIHHPDGNPFSVFTGRRSFVEHSVSNGVFQTMSFHDAVLDHSRLLPNGVALRIWKIWFGPVFGYNAFCTKGAELNLVFDRFPPDSVMLAIWDSFDREIFGLQYDPVRRVISADLADIYGLKFSIDPAQSSFEWLFQPLAPEPASP